VNRRTLIRSLFGGAAAALVVPSTAYFFLGQSGGLSTAPWWDSHGFLNTGASASKPITYEMLKEAAYVIPENYGSFTVATWFKNYSVIR